MEKELRIIISGGGTGGHIFPAVSIANAIIELRPDAEILFVGAEGRMEMQRVPDAGYRIIGLPIAGFDRKHLWKNVAPPASGGRCRRICKRANTKDCRNDGSPHINPGAKLVCRSN